MKLKNEYNKITFDIINNKKFNLLKHDIHHGSNKFDHCKRVSYLSFLIAKKLNANYKEVARAGLLHDFFFGQRTSKKENDYLNHPYTSAKNAKHYFNINKNEENIIVSHMYPYAFFKRLTPFITLSEKKYLKVNKPKNKEEIIVCISDLLVSIYEVFKFKIQYSLALYILFIINIIKY